MDKYEVVRETSRKYYAMAISDLEHGAAMAIDHARRDPTCSEGELRALERHVAQSRETLTTDHIEHMAHIGKMPVSCPTCGDLVWVDRP